MCTHKDLSSALTALLLHKYGLVPYFIQGRSGEAIAVLDVPKKLGRPTMVTTRSGVSKLQWAREHSGLLVLGRVVSGNVEVETERKYNFEGQFLGLNIKTIPNIRYSFEYNDEGKIIKTQVRNNRESIILKDPDCSLHHAIPDNRFNCTYFNFQKIGEDKFEIRHGTVDSFGSGKTIKILKDGIYYLMAIGPEVYSFIKPDSMNAIDWLLHKAMYKAMLKEIKRARG